MLDIERVLPHSIDIERAVLGAILLHGESLQSAATVIGPDDFFRDAHRRIFRAMLALYERHAAIDPITLSEELRKAGDYDEVGGGSYLASLTDGTPRMDNLRAYGEFVREKRRLRDIIAAARMTIDEAYEAGDSSVEICQRIEVALGTIIQHGEPGLRKLGDVLLDYVVGLDAKDRKRAIKTGFADLDTLIDGLYPGDLVIVAARPSTGKTSFALGVAEHVARTTGAVPYFSLETKETKAAARLLALRSGVPAKILERGEASAIQYQAVTNALTSSAEIPMYLEFGSRTVAELAGWCRRLMQTETLACLVVDYLQLLAPHRERESREAEVASVGQSLKDLALLLNIPVVALAQLSRAPEARKDKRPTPADVRESGALEQIADLMLLLFRQEMYDHSVENAGIAEVIVGKNRDGPTGVVRLAFMQSLARFANLAPDSF